MAYYRGESNILEHSNSTCGDGHRVRAASRRRGLSVGTDAHFDQFRPVPCVGQCGTVPHMGQREEYLESDSYWHSSLTRDERLSRWPSSASFGVALAGKAARALRAADQAVAIAEAAHEMVLHQAVYALLDAEESVREIADHLSLSKSRVGRIVKRLTAADGSIANLAFVGPRGTQQASRALVLDAWRFSSLDGTLEDHPRGTHEPDPTSGPTNFGGLNS